MNFFVLLVLFEFLKSSTFAQTQFPIGRGPVDHSPSHIGIDLGSKVGEKLSSPISGKIVYIVKDLLGKSNWQGVVIKGTGEDTAYVVRILGVKVSKVLVGKSIKKGQLLGVIIDAKRVFGKVEQHIHAEILKNDKLINPELILKKRWPNKKAVNAGVQYEDPQLKKMSFIQGGFLKSQKAIANALKNSLAMPVWETFNFEPYLHLADSYAKFGDFKSAVETQKQLISLLRAELECAKKKIPPKILGTIAACRSEQSLGILIFGMNRNLDAYKKKKKTVVFY